MAYIKYESEFYSLNPDTPDSRFQIRIHKKTGSGSTTDFSVDSDGFVLTMDGGDDSMLSPLKTTSCEFTFIIEQDNTDQEEIIDDLLAIGADNEDELALEIRRYQDGVGFRRYWIGVILGDLSEVADTSPQQFIRIKAVDGLAQLKYKPFPISKEGNRSCLYYIKAALMEITTSHDDFGFWTADDATTENFLTHQPFYYNVAMGSINSSSWRDDLDNDPLALTKISSLVFKGDDGQYWSHYKIIENIISAFQLRLMMTPIRDDSSASGGSFFNGNCTWLLQSPLAYHYSSNNSNRDISGHKFFLHGKTLATDEALSYEDISHGVYNPETIIAGATQTYIPPLLSYKSIYEHSNFLGLSLGPATIQTAWNDVDTEGGTGGVNSTSGYGYLYTSTSDNPYYPLEGVTADAPSFGWPGSINDKVSSSRIVITGNCKLHPKMHAYEASGGSVGYDSAGEYFEYYGGESLGNGWWGIYDDAVIMPRLALRVSTLIADPDGSITFEGSEDTFRKDYFWLGDRRFGTLAGSTAWGRRDEGVYPAEDLKLRANEDNNYPQNMYGFNNTFDGTRFWPSYPDSTSYIDDDDIQQWGTDIGYSDMYWWRSDVDGSEQYPYMEKLHAFISPVYHQSDVVARNGQVSSSSWDDDVWDSECTDYGHSETFVITSGRIPVGQPAAGGDIGPNYISRVIMFCLMRCDDATTSTGAYQRAACKSWDYSSLYTSGSSSGGYGCEARGIQWDYYLSDVRIYITGDSAGADSFDTTIAWYENTNGNASDEMTQEPEIVIGDNPPEDPFAWSDDPLNSGFGGQYPGQFKIYTKADDYGLPETGSNTQKWRPIWALSSGGAPLHKMRAELGLAHYYMIKRGLRLTFSDRTSTKEIEQKLASGFYYWISSHKWGENQEGADVGYLINGFEFVAGTGMITIDFEDAVTFSRAGLTDKTYSTNG